MLLLESKDWQRTERRWLIPMLKNERKGLNGKMECVALNMMLTDPQWEVAFPEYTVVEIGAWRNSCATLRMYRYT